MARYQGWDAPYPMEQRFRPADDVYAETTAGGFAELACVAERLLAPKPTHLTFEQAAAVPVAAVTALQGLRDVGAVQPGQAVLINGASGGVGTFAAQIAKTLGATTSTSPASIRWQPAEAR